MNKHGVVVDYLDYYHFLEGLTDYWSWPSRIATKYKHKPILREADNLWTQSAKVSGAFAAVFDRYKDATIVVSYRTNGSPAIEEILGALRSIGRPEPSLFVQDYKYALAREACSEVVIVSKRRD
jgi:adenine-specific DNA methylase